MATVSGAQNRSNKFINYFCPRKIVRSRHRLTFKRILQRERKRKRNEIRTPNSYTRPRVRCYNVKLHSLYFIVRGTLRTTIRCDQTGYGYKIHSYLDINAVPEINGVYRIRVFIRMH